MHRAVFRRSPSSVPDVAPFLTHKGCAVKICIVGDYLSRYRERIQTLFPTDEVLWAHTAEDDIVRDALEDLDVFVGPVFTSEMAHRARRLRLVQVPGAGTDGVAIDALPPSALCANVYRHESSVAEYVLGAAIALRRRFQDQDRNLRQDIWDTATYDPSVAYGRTLLSAEVGFVGYGHIGAATWTLLEAIGVRGGRAVSRSGKSAEGRASSLKWLGTPSDTDRLFDESDLVVVSAPLSAETNGLIGAEQLDLLGKDGIIINVGRAGLIQEEPLFNALQRGTIAGAAVDVWYSYPEAGSGRPSSYPFKDLTNILMTPHSAALTDETYSARLEDIAINIERSRKGFRPINLVMP